MSRRRNRTSAETGLSPELRGPFIDFSGSTSHGDDDFLELEPDEELLCSVSEIAEHLGRNITVVLETALSEIRKMVSIRIRVLKMELREKTLEVDDLKARLDAVQRDSKDALSGLTAAELTAEAGFRKHDLGASSKHNNSDPRRVKAPVPGVKKENIDAICDYLMKDKNSRGCTDTEDQLSHADKAAPPEPEPHPLHLWPDSGMGSSGPAQGDAEAAAEDIFSMLPSGSGSKRMYEYEWMAPMDYSSDLKVLKEPAKENVQHSDVEDDENDDELSGAGGGGPEQIQASVSHVQPAEFSMASQSSPGHTGSPLEGTAEPPDSDAEINRRESTCDPRLLGHQRGLDDPAMSRASAAPKIFPDWNQQTWHIPRIQAPLGESWMRASLLPPVCQVGAGEKRKRRRCKFCKSSDDVKTSTTCSKCGKFICRKHTVMNCYPCAV
ncbi:zinc finger protein 16-like isoform X2 [Oryzias melastigma]|uniref:zinc finger protein 16-like isoform X2 n=1 Tax=Oryzias melastigma TaxID=30732 RepID=UPI000CF81D65|nr:zinc finger protein 16-like isoform X2 [Oryzias melastigma]